MQRTPIRTVLLTGFDAFGGDAVNPSWLAVERLRGEILAGHRVETAQLPTAFERAPQALRAAIRRHRPALVLCIGQAGGRSAISFERVAINVIDARIPDNDGAQPVDAPVAKGGPAAYFSTLPIKSLRAALLAAGIPAEISQTAGTFVCNQVFYALMRALARMPAPRPRGGFVHVPFLPEQVDTRPGTPSMPLDTIVVGLRTAIGTALRTKRDLRTAGGETH
ncbi:pyroglutamyl-peptidase I [Lysobacter hankyongensis]|uniref:Pyrrolidone-carboxylate peptidase n=1 Tax=Lysobacter hankyongensis TaxID=1176535 RepID=A0ABP9AG14_9GAMM